MRSRVHIAIAALLSTTLLYSFIHCGETRLRTVASAARVSPDFNGDGYVDKIVGSYHSGVVTANKGAVFVYYGAASGLQPTTTRLDYPGSDTLSNFGFSATSAGDINGDGYDDIIVGAYGADVPTVDQDAVFIYYGSSSGIQTNPTAISYPLSDTSSSFGYSVAGAGDVNHDGYADVIIGAPSSDYLAGNRGAVFIYYGSSNGITSNYTLISNPGLDANAQFGAYVAGVGDTNGDGYDDVMVGAYLSDVGAANKGAAFVFYGSSAGTTTTGYTTLSYPNADAAAQYGGTVSAAGDLNHDGYKDVVVGAYGADSGGVDRGGAFVYYGSSSGVQTTATQIYYPSELSSNFGQGVGAAGDVNGDGYDDLVVGAPSSDIGSANLGAVYIFYGSASGVQTSTTNVISNPGGDASAFFGEAVYGVGDVNGDGFKDIMVAARSSDVSGANLGSVFIFYGSATGVQSLGYSTLSYPGSDANSGFGQTLGP